LIRKDHARRQKEVQSGVFQMFEKGAVEGEMDIAASIGRFSLLLKFVPTVDFSDGSDFFALRMASWMIDGRNRTRVAARCSLVGGFRGWMCNLTKEDYPIRVDFF
jgi:hypothetical protein